MAVRRILGLLASERGAILLLLGGLAWLAGFLWL
jgi:hypothetical protein